MKILSRSIKFFSMAAVSVMSAADLGATVHAAQNANSASLGKAGFAGVRAVDDAGLADDPPPVGTLGIRG